MDNRLELWRKIADKHLEYKDPRFEEDPLILTMMAGENFQKAVAFIILGDYARGFKYLSRCRTVLMSKIYNPESADYMDLFFWQLWGWISEEEKDLPNPDNLIISKHRQVVEMLEHRGTGEMARWYEPLTEQLKIKMRNPLTPRHRNPGRDEKPYMDFAFLMLDLARQWTWYDPMDPEPLQSLLEAAFLSMGQGNLLLVDRLGMKRQDINFSRLVDLELLKKAHPDKFPLYREFIRWEQGRLNFFYYQCRVLTSVAEIAREPGNISHARDCDEALEAMFADARKPQGEAFESFDLLCQVQMARIGSVFALLEHSKKPLNVLGHYLGGTGE